MQPYIMVFYPDVQHQLLYKLCHKIYFTSNGLSTNLDGCQCKHNLLFSIDVGVQYTQNVLKLLRNDKGLWKQ